MRLTAAAGLENVHDGLCVFDRGRRNLFVRDCKFRATFKSGAEKRRFSVPLLLNVAKLISQNHNVN